MQHVINRSLSLIIAVLILNGCGVLFPSDNSGKTSEVPIVIEPVIVQPPVIEEPLVFPEKLKPVDWPTTLEQFVEKMVKSSNATTGSVVLLDTIKNQTNGSLDTEKLTQTLLRMIDSTKQFSLISQEQLVSAKQALGIQSEDSLGSRSKTIGLARYMHTPYVLYTEVDGDSNTPQLSMQLLDTQSGEIVWTQSGDITREL